MATTTSLMIGIVSDLDDPERLGRVKVRFPELGDQESDWARLVAPFAGDGRGAFFRPEVDDEVLVGFEHGDKRRPYVLGGLWSTADPPPDDDGRPSDNNWRFITSRSGHVIKLDDTRGQEVIEIVTNDGERRVVLDTAGRKIEVVSQSGDVEVKAVAGKVKVEALDIELKGQTSVKVEAPSVELKAQGQMTVDGGATLTLRGGVIQIN